MRALPSRNLLPEPVGLGKWWPSASRSSMVVVLASQVSRPAFILRRLRSYLMRRSVMKARSVRGVACPILRFNHLHWRPFPEGWWRLDVLIEEEKGMFTKIQVVGEDCLPQRLRSSFVEKVSQRSSVTCCRCQIHSVEPLM